MGERKNQPKLVMYSNLKCERAEMQGKKNISRRQKTMERFFH
jgi:hypothetical protein